MLHFLQPAATLFIGLALSVYGLIQAFLHAPPVTAFQTAAKAMPDAMAVLVFGFGVTAIIAGIFLLISGVRGVRSRYRDIDRAYGPRSSRPRKEPRHDPRDPYGYDEDWDDQAVYH